MSDIEMIYETLEGKHYVTPYHRKHGTESALILTMYNEKKALKAIRKIRDRIRNKTVVEIGAGVGYLAIAMAEYAKNVIAIEVDPGWSWYFVEYLYRHKPKNLIWIFGDAREIVKYIKTDVAVICSLSGIESMKKIAERMATEIILFWQEDKKKNGGNENIEKT